MRDFTQLGYIFDQLREEPEPTGFQALVARALQDCVLPQDDTKGSPGRNAQAELYVSAVCRKAGLRPVEHEEPDIRCWLDGKEYGIAVKRLTSLSKVVRRVAEGRRQIVKTGLPGIITLDICIALNPENRRDFSSVTGLAFAAARMRELRRLVKSHYTQLRQAAKTTWVRGALLLDHRLRLDPEDGWGVESLTLSLPLAEHNQRRSREFDAFCERYVAALPNHVPLPTI